MSGTAECPVCDLVHLLKKRNVTAYLYSPLSFIPSRMMRGLSEAGYRPEERGMFIEVRAEEFPALIRAAGNMGGLTQMEKDAVTLCFLEEGSSFGMESLAHTKSLAQWERILGAGDLLEVLQQGRIVTRFQPIVDFGAKEMFACECLSRGEKGDGTLISPGELFGSAKKAGLLFSLDKACRMSAIHTAGELGMEDGCSSIFCPRPFTTRSTASGRPRNSSPSSEWSLPASSSKWWSRREWKTCPTSGRSLISTGPGDS